MNLVENTTQPHNVNLQRTAKATNIKQSSLTNSDFQRYNKYQQ